MADLILRDRPFKGVNSFERFFVGEKVKGNQPILGFTSENKQTRSDTVLAERI